MNNNRAYEAEECFSGVFWFFKPCTFLVEQQNNPEALKLLHFM